MEEDCEELKRNNKLYLTILMRYKDYIEENESLNVAELPRLITPEDPQITAFVNKIKDNFPNFSYEKNFYEVALMLHKHVKEEIAIVNLPVQFWLMPSETITIGAGDLIDKATLLCSELIALGNITAKVIIKVNENERRIGVYCEYNGKISYFDIDDGAYVFDNKEEMLKSLGIKQGNNVSAYEFNNHMYNDLA
mgnify:FL=1